MRRSRSMSVEPARPVRHLMTGRNPIESPGHRDLRGPSGPSPRLARLALLDPDLAELAKRVVRLSARGLPRMYLPESGTFAFTRQRNAQGACPTLGTSLRYGAIVALGAACLEPADQRSVLTGQTAAEFCARLASQVDSATNLGDTALITWASAELGLPSVAQTVAMLLQRLASSSAPYTVEMAWTLSALAAALPHTDRAVATSVRDRLLNACCPSGGLFGHWTEPAQAPWTRAHVGCFADQVYPIQALARWHRAAGDADALACAARCAEQICRLQGPAGQWWWHYDIRTGGVVEGYPVYTVHQDSMAPMALLDLYAAGGPDFMPAIARGLAWIQDANEVNCNLVDETEVLIWRSVRRRDPAKLVRKVRAAATRVAPRLRLRWLDATFPPAAIDFEDRPYHLGWILYAWLTQP